VRLGLFTKVVKMPYKSAKQRAYLHIHEPVLAKKWDKEYGGKVKPKKAAAKKGKKK
jgi:hypothetical protein